MDEATIIGFVVVGLTAVIGLFFTVGKPIIELNKTLTSIQSKIDAVVANLNKTDDRVTKHGKEIEDVQRQVDRHEIRISNLEEQNKVDKYGA